MSDASIETTQCQECGRQLATKEEQIATEGGVFCRSCFDILKQQVGSAIERQGRDVNYLAAVVGALAGGALGSAVWWGFTILTEIAFGLVAIVIGWCVAKGILLLTGGKRSLQLQVISVAVAGASFFYASYLVTQSFIPAQLRPAFGLAPGTDFLPSWDAFVEVVSAGFGLKDLIFLAIVVWESWRGVAPLTAPPVGGGQ